MKTTLTTLAFVAAAMTAQAAPVKYSLDASHSQIVFSYNHIGFSTTYGMYSGFDGEIMFDADSPENSSVSVTMPVKSMITGWEKRTGHFMSPDFLNAAEDYDVTFVSTGIEVTGDKTAVITGDLTLNGITKAVALDTTINNNGTHPRSNKPWIGFDATATILRSDFGAGAFAPAVSDEVNLIISIEAGAAE